MSLFPELETQAGATFDETRFYRYRLWRVWDNKHPKLAWLMLNPSTADEQVLDRTMRQCVRYTQRWGFGGLEVVNLFAMRSTDPDAMKAFAGDSVGPDNDAHILQVADDCGSVVCAWGTDGKHRNREGVVKELLAKSDARLMCLGRNSDGTPKHPLYLAASLHLEPFA